MKVLLVDNFDSFTYNLAEALLRRQAKITVRRNNTALPVLLKEATASDLAVLSPGPGTPKDAGQCISLLQSLPEKTPVFGVCLGHQAIVEAFGGVVGPAGAILHGKASRIHHNETGLFAGVPNPLSGGRYHSLCALTLPPCLLETARSQDGVVMAVKHKNRPIYSVQFHPESILTSAGEHILDNLLEELT